MKDQKSEMMAVITAILTEKLGVSESEITENAKLTSDLGADSLDVVELSMEIEKRLGIRIPDSSMNSISTVGDILTTVYALSA